MRTGIISLMYEVLNLSSLFDRSDNKGALAIDQNVTFVNRKAGGQA